MKIKKALIMFCLASVVQICAMHDATKQCKYNEEATQDLNKLMWSGVAHHKPKLLKLLDNGANPDVDTGGLNQQKFLHLVVGLDFDLVESALRHGANPNAVDHCGRTPLYQACDSYAWDVDLGQKVIAALLLAGADLEIKNRWGGTPLAELRRCNPKHVPAVQTIVSAVPLVKAEREAYNPGVAQLLSAHLPQPIAGITMDFVGSKQVWDDECWPLFKKYMAQAQKNDQARRLK